MLAGAFHVAGSDRQAPFAVEVAAHSFHVGLVVRMSAATASVRSCPAQGLHGGGIFEGVEQVEDEGHVPSGQDFLADSPDP